MYMPSEWGKHYPWGLHRHAGNWVFVSRGVGTVGVPVRMWAPPDVGILDVTGTIAPALLYEPQLRHFFQCTARSCDRLESRLAR
jgi:hypothetical protein